MGEQQHWSGSGRFLATAIAAIVFGGVGVESAQAQASGDRPKYTGSRHDEDWSFLRDVSTEAQADLWDPIKYIALNDDGSTWVSFGGSTRLRLENWWNFGFLPSDVGNDTFLLWRALFHADLHIGDNVRVFAQGKSAQSTDRDLPGGRRTLDVDSLDLQQGFADLRLDLADESTVTLRAGRQEYRFGKQRLVSPLPWANTLRSWDGVTGIAKWRSWSVTGFWSQFVPVQKYDFNTADAQRPFYGVYATDAVDTAWLKGLDLYFLGLANRDEVNFNGTIGSEDRYTVGGRIWGKFGESDFDYDLEGAYQFGRVDGGDVSAYMIGTQVGYKAADWVWSPRFFLGFEMGSGDDDPGGDVQTFNQLFPLGHAYFGYIDQIGRQNALDLLAGASFAPIDKLTVKAIGHFFWRDSKNDALYNAGGGVVRPGNLSDAREIGQEIDIVGTYKIDQHTTAELGYSHFFPGSFIEDTGPSTDIDFLYLQIRYVF